MPFSNQNLRSWVIRTLFIVLSLILIGRLFSMQVLNDRYEMLAKGQAIYRKVIYPARGIIMDRNGVDLLTNQTTFDLAVTPNKVEQLDTAMFCDIMNINKAEFDKRMKQLRIRNGGVRQSIFEAYLSDEKNAKLQENIYLFPGFDLVERTSRIYPQKIGPHILGFLNEVSPRMLKKKRYQTYQQGDYVGITGLENVYEEELRGQRGVEYMVKDVLNRPRNQYKNGAMDTVAIAGQNLKLFLDAGLQALGEKLMKGKIGAIVAIEPKTGGILAMVSAPSYDPNLLTGSDFGKHYNQLYRDYTRPLFDRAIQAQYQPGSTFKPIDALIGLKTGVITPDFGYPCRGGYYACGRRIGCTETWAGHAANLELALAWSCNAYFCDVFRRIVDSKQWKGGTHEGLQRWHDYLYSFGLGHALGVDITGEYPGNIPDSNYYNSIYNYNWNSCNMVTCGIGQGEISMTPIQMANVVAMIANRGYYYTPHFVESIGDNAKDAKLKPYLVKHKVGIPDSDFEAVIKGMEDVVKSGTGRTAQLPGIAVCGKTGTVENYAMIGLKRVKLDNHSVWVTFAPKDNPKIAIAVVVQNAGYGASWACPIASIIMEKYLTDTVKRTALKERMENSNTIKKYTYIIDSLQREKDYMRAMLKTANQHTKDSIRKTRDTMLVKEILREYYNMKIK